MFSTKKCPKNDKIYIFEYFEYLNFEYIENFK